ncbi:MAG: hypothetical protein HC835_13460 [Oscillatoriales cyanobacterium RM2_1_1]|nr:hypothetical protein [Oscillatoriales cyanobacterium RM2_1_1]
MVTSSPEMPTKLKRVSIYLEPEVKGLIDGMADNEHRSVANMISVLVLEALEARGIVLPEKSDESGDKQSQLEVKND